MISDPIYVALEVTRILESLGVKYVIGGSLASTTYGRVRTTLDVDLVADLHLEHVNPFIQALGNAYYMDPILTREAIERHSSFNLIHLETMFKVDIFIPKQRPFDRQQLARGVKRAFNKDEDGFAYVASPEDTILAKLEWYHLGGEVSERQWRDIQGIIEVQGDRLDYDYLRKWADSLKVTSLLDRALSEAGKTP